MAITITTNNEAVRERAQRIVEAMTPDKIDGVVAGVAMKTLRSVQADTPRGWTGQLKQGWEAVRQAPGVWDVKSKFTGPEGDWWRQKMNWLEFGTQAHGPRYARALYIPISLKGHTAYKQNANWGWSGGEVKSKGEKVKGVTTYARGANTDKTKRVSLVFGVDYILTKYVEGIKAMSIVYRNRQLAQMNLIAAMRAYVQAAVSGKGGLPNG